MAIAGGSCLDQSRRHEWEIDLVDVAEIPRPGRILSDILSSADSLLAMMEPSFPGAVISRAMASKATSSYYPFNKVLHMSQYPGRYLVDSDRRLFSLPGDQGSPSRVCNVPSSRILC